MIPEVVIHNSISLDGSLIGFEPDMVTHYGLVGELSCDIHLIGSNTAVTGLELFGGVPPEGEYDLEPPKVKEELPYWAVIDSGGKLMEKLHGLRASGYCRDVIALVAEDTPGDYIYYLESRNYPFHRVGTGKVDLDKALELLNEVYGARRVLVDAGRILSNLLLEKGLATWLSILVHPVIVGKEGYDIFGNLRGAINLISRGSKSVGDGLVWCQYEPVYDRSAIDLDVLS